MRVTCRCSGPFRLPTERNWSKQHPRLRTPRPLVDRFNLGNLHPNKEWWRERRIAPATFMGFPDVSKAEIRGGALYTEQMDAATLAVIVDKCVKDGITNADFWAQFSWRTQQLCPKISETEAAYIFRSFSRADWFDSHLALSLWGRIDWLLPRFMLGDISVVVEGFLNPRFRNERYERKVLQHMLLLVEARKDWTAEELCRAAASVGLIEAGASSIDIRRAILEKTAVLMETADLSLVGVDRLARALHSFAFLEISNQPEVLFAIVRDLKDSGKLMEKKRALLGEQSVSLCSSLVKLGFSSVEKNLIADLLTDYYDNIYILSHSGLLDAVRMQSLLNEDHAHFLPKDHADVLFLRVSREGYKLDKHMACEMVASLARLNSSSPVAKEALQECLARVAAVGVDGVHIHIRQNLRSALESTSDKSNDVKALIEILSLSP